MVEQHETDGGKQRQTDQGRERSVARDMASTAEKTQSSVANLPTYNHDSTDRKSWFRWLPSPPHRDPNAIGDMRFTSQLRTLENLKTFLLSEGVDIRAEDVPLFSFGALYQLKYVEGARLPSVEEWDQIDKRSQKLFSYLSDDLRKRFQLRQTANLIAGVPVGFIVLALFSLMTASLTTDRNQLLFFYLLWTVSLGGLGAIAYLSMNALAIQSDVTFDLTNHRLLAVRIILGCLFGLVLSIPFGFESFVTFSESISRGSTAAVANTFGSLGLQAAFLLLPFILGFSTSLVVLVPNRFIESISVFFGDRRSGV
jgi:hypothetical protein